MTLQVFTNHKTILIIKYELVAIYFTRACQMYLTLLNSSDDKYPKAWKMLLWPSFSSLWQILMVFSEKLNVWSMFQRPRKSQRLSLEPEMKCEYWFRYLKSSLEQKWKAYARAHTHKRMMSNFEGANLVSYFIKPRRELQIISQFKRYEAPVW